MGIEDFYNLKSDESSYAVLGLHRSASLDEVKTAYYKLAWLYHPDLNPNNRQAEDRLKEVNAAYESLCSLLMSSPEPVDVQTIARKGMGDDRDLSQSNEVYNTFVDALLGRSSQNHHRK